MTYLGKVRRGGVTSVSDNHSPHAPSFNPKHISLHLCLPSSHCWDLGQPSPVVKPSKLSPLKKKNTFVQTQLTSVSFHSADKPSLLTQACSAWQRFVSLIWTECKGLCACFRDLVIEYCEHGIY